MTSNMKLTLGIVLANLMIGGSLLAGAMHTQDRARPVPTHPVSCVSKPGVPALQDAALCSIV